MTDYVICAAWVANCGLWFLIGKYARSLRDLRQLVHYNDERLLSVERQLDSQASGGTVNGV